MSTTGRRRAKISITLDPGLLNAVSDTPIRQGAADFRLLARPVVEVFQKQVRERTLFLRGLVNWVGFRASAVRFRPGARRGGATKYPAGRMLRFALTGIVSMSRFPLRAAGVASTPGSVAPSEATSVTVVVERDGTVRVELRALDAAAAAWVAALARALAPAEAP